MSLPLIPFVSVVVCAFNEEQGLQLCLDGLAAQTYPKARYEVLVVDDESSDSTFTIASDFINALPDNVLRMRLVRIRHGGLSVARNAGIQMSRGDTIAFIDGDAVPEPAWIAELVKPFSAGADYVGGRINLLNTGAWVAQLLQRTRHRQFFGPRFFNDHFVGCNMAFRKEVFQTLGGFHENFVTRGDESTLLARMRGRFQYAAAPDAIVLHERPDTVRASIRVEWKSATLVHLVAKATGRHLSWRDVICSFERFCMMLFPAFLALVWVRPALLIFPLSIAAVAFIRRLFLRPLNRAIARGMLDEYGCLRGLVGHILYYYVYNVVSLWGELASPWLHHQASIVSPLTTELTILQSVETAE